MRNVYDFNDPSDTKTAGRILASIVNTPAWSVLHQLAISIRETDLARETPSADDVARLNGRQAGMKALLTRAEELAKRGVAEEQTEQIARTIVNTVGTGPV